MIHEQIVNQPMIEAERFDLRPLQPSDAGLIALHAGDRRVAETTGTIPHPLPPGWTEGYIARVQADDRTEDAWAIDATKVGGPELLGVVLLKYVDDDMCEIGFWVAPQFWNSGIASEAVQTLVTANPRNCRAHVATVFQGSAASARVLTNCGFRYLGDAEGFCVAQGATMPTWTYSRKQD